MGENEGDGGKMRELDKRGEKKTYLSACGILLLLLGVFLWVVFVLFFFV